MENGKLSSDEQLGSQAGYSSVYVSYPVKFICKCTHHPSFPREEKSPCLCSGVYNAGLGSTCKAPDEYDHIHCTSENARKSLPS